MDTLLRYRVFAQVAGMRSFVKAANALELPRATGIKKPRQVGRG